MGEEDLASQLPWLQPFGLFCVGRLWIKGQSKVSQQNQGPDPKDQGGDGVPRQEHRGEGLQAVQVHWKTRFSVCSSADLFLLQ